MSDGRTQPPPDPGLAGASARREYERRRAAREQRVRSEHKHLGGLILAFQEPPAHERAWARGAEGEQKVAASLGRHLGPEAVLLHDRRVPGSRANIDHIAVAAAGVWVIDAKRYKGRVWVRRPLLGEAKLTIAGRDRSSLVVGLAKQVRLVRHVVEAVVPGTPVHGALCFVDADLPLIGSLSFGGFPLLYPKPLAKRIRARGPLPPLEVQLVATKLASAFRPA